MPYWSTEMDLYSISKTSAFKHGGLTIDRGPVCSHKIKKAKKAPGRTLLFERKSSNFKDNWTPKYSIGSSELPPFERVLFIVFYEFWKPCE